VTTPLTGFVVLGSNGEAVLLDDDEADSVIAAARKSVPSGRPLIAGAGRESTRAAVEAARRAADLGADAVLVRTPAFFKPQMTSDAFVRHYTAVADASPVPVLLITHRPTGGTAPGGGLAAAAHPNIAGMKESGGDVAQIARIVSGTPEGFSVLAGSSSTFTRRCASGRRAGFALASSPKRASAYQLAKPTPRPGAALQEQIAPMSRVADRPTACRD
jgi:4-hydroxy-2-oxoglutarate aldolase